MKIYQYPPKSDWKELLKRPVNDPNQMEETVALILDEVKRDGDKAVRKFTLLYDGVQLDELTVSPAEFAKADTLVDEKLKEAIQIAAGNIRKFHGTQFEKTKVIETMPGVKCWRKSVPIGSVGLYIPGGSAPLFSTVLMLGIPAKLAGCKEIVLCTPPQKDGTVNPVVLYTAKLVGCERVIKVGGVQAIGGMAYGTETIPAVDKIFGPGNQYVTEAKQLVSKAGLAIDMPAGPSEVMVVADSSARAEFIAADLLSQAEHGADSQVMLLTMDEALISEVQLQITAQLKVLPRKEIAQQCLENSTMILLKTMGEMLEMVNEYAPEHLIVALRDAVDFSAGVINSGSVFLGNYSPEAVGDYASGTNHTLPTNGAARAYSGVSIDSFVKKITFQKITRQGLLNIGPAVEIMAEAEQLDGHKNAVTVRLNVLAGENLKRTPASNNK